MTATPHDEPQPLTSLEIKGNNGWWGMYSLDESSAQKVMDYATSLTGETVSPTIQEPERVSENADSEPQNKNNQQDLINFVKDPKNIAKAVEGSMEKRQAVIDAAQNKESLRDAFDKEFLHRAGHEDNGNPDAPATHCVWHRHDELLRWFEGYIETHDREIEQEVDVKARIDELKQSNAQHLQNNYCIASRRKWEAYHADRLQHLQSKPKETS